MLNVAESFALVSSLQPAEQQPACVYFYILRVAAAGTEQLDSEQAPTSPHYFRLAMPWQPFRRKNKYRHVEHQEEETSFDELLPRSVSDGNLVR